MFDAEASVNRYSEVESFLSEHPQAARLWVCAMYFPPNSLEFHAVRGYGLLE